MDQFEDPVLDLTWGGFIRGNNFIKLNDSTLISKEPAKYFLLNTYLYINRTNSVDHWISQMQKLIHEVESRPIEISRKIMENWWNSFWNRSYVHIIPANRNRNQNPMNNKGKSPEFSWRK